MNEESICHREALPRDEAFIMRNWLVEFWRSKHSGTFNHDDYFAAQRAKIEEILAWPQAKVLVAANPQEGDSSHEIFGYLVYEPADVPVIHWAFVKRGLRKNRVFRYLCWAADIDLKKPLIYTHRTMFAGVLIRNLTRKGELTDTRHDPAFARNAPGQREATRRKKRAA